MNIYHKHRCKMNQVFPHLFPARGGLTIPLEKGISQSLTSHPNLPISKKAARWFLSIWCGRPEYHKAILNFDHRVGMNGELTQEITAAHKAHAAARLKAQAEKREKIAA